MKQRKIYVVGNSLEYANWMQGKLTQTMEQADLVLFTGGADVTPGLYAEEAHSETSNDARRDAKEVAEFKKALALDIPMIGICRGAQFLCVMAGGKLVQDMENKYSQHPIQMWDGSIQQITSTHHQAMCPFNLAKDEYHLLGWGENLSNHHEGGKREELSEYWEDFKEAEICYFPDIKALCIQGHPEYSFQNKETLVYLQDMLDKFLVNKLIEPILQ